MSVAIYEVDHPGCSHHSKHNFLDCLLFYCSSFESAYELVLKALVEFECQDCEDIDDCHQLSKVDRITRNCKVCLRSS